MERFLIETRRSGKLIERVIAYNLKEATAQYEETYSDVACTLDVVNLRQVQRKPSLVRTTCRCECVHGANAVGRRIEKKAFACSCAWHLDHVHCAACGGHLDK